MSEINLQHEIISWLNLYGHAVWKNEVFVMPGRNGSWRAPANAHTPDIVGALKDGRGIFIECKEEKYREPVTELWENICRGNYSARIKFKLNNAKDTKRCLAQADHLDWIRTKTGGRALTMFAFHLRDVQLKLGIEP